MPADFDPFLDLDGLRRDAGAPKADQDRALLDRLIAIPPGPVVDRIRPRENFETRQEPAEAKALDPSAPETIEIKTVAAMTLSEPEINAPPVIKREPVEAVAPRPVEAAASVEQVAELPPPADAASATEIPSDVRASPRKAKARNAAKAGEKGAANRATKRKARVRTTVSQPTATTGYPVTTTSTFDNQFFRNQSVRTQ